jgi:ataxia telangiectasia mutated family protein
MGIVGEKPGNFNSSNLAHIHLTIARFIDEQYGQVTRMDELARRSRLVAETRSSLESCRANLSRLSTTVSSEERIALERNVYELNQQYQADQEEYSKRLKETNTFLLKSLTNYISALSYGCKSDTEQISTISRICALWFQHHQEITVNEIINSSIPGQNSKSSLSVGIKTVPVRYYLPLIYQLAARATYNPAHSTPNEFQKVLLRLLVQMLLSHPFDCVYQFLALKAGGQNEMVLSQAKRRRLVDSANLNRDSEAEGRAAAAALVIEQVKKGSPQLANIIVSIEQLCDAYIELAKHNFSETESKLILQQANPFPSNLAIKKLLYPLPADSPFKNITIATCTSETVHFAGFVDRFRALRGINLPKLVEVISTTGSRHQQLVKGNDDVRQDAVMEQVFHRVNQLLKTDRETRKRNLSMRTYRVIPLRPLVGLIEFVSNSITFSDYLKGAHERLRPSDLKPDECRLKLQAESDRAGSTVRSKFNVLVNEIGSRFKPVLRHFFFEHFQMSEWWSARQAYIRSMATASILGWIVGLGDRHGMNILLDKNTGEVVHIDLNMIFEAGKTLRIPERVPFRLTPDCVDAMGPEQLGLAGPFKQNAIAVLKILRKERNALIMVLDVFKYDPLQKWTGMAAAAHQESSSHATCSIETSSNTSNSTFVTKAAERALLRIREKLEGREEGSILSESGHVSYLIHTATDPEMLCQMFYGWQAYF